MEKVLSRSLIAFVIACIIAFGAVPAFAGHKDAGEKSEEDLGLRKTSLYSEEKETPAHGEYSHVEPGKSKRMERSFENSPPLIPHDLTGMLPIAETNNSCLNCHMPDAALAMNATPLPKSHFVDMDTGKDLHGSLDGKRFNCMQCHVPQVKIPEAIKNTFKADFRSKKSKTRSDLLDTLNEGVKAE